MKEELFNERMSYCAEQKSGKWELNKVMKICKNLKSGKARDRDDLIFELFKPDLAGEDLPRSLTHMFNGIKSSLIVPDFLQKMAVTSLYKNKGSKSDFANQRGVFNLSKVRGILDKLLYADVYPIIDNELSYSNIGGRKGRNIRDHLFVIYAVINDVMNGASPPVDFQSLDIFKCFDEMWFEETHNDLFDVKVQDDKFALIAKLDEKAKVIVKTPCGPTDEFTLEQIVMQGSVFGPIKSTIQIDTLGRDCQSNNQGMFKYKNVLDITPLAFIDDCLGFSKCGADSVELNSIINTKIDSKKMRLSSKKCHHLHFSKTSTKCFSNLKADNQPMQKSTVCSYLGDILSSNGSLDATIEQRRQKGVGICSQITGMVNGLSLGHHYYKISFMFRDCMLVNGILTNANVWYQIKDAQIDTLENIDLMLIRKLVKGHSKAPKEAFYLETGLLPIRFVIKKRRLMFLHNILNLPGHEIVRKVYNVQKQITTKNDWYNLVQENKTELKITLSDEEISKISEEKFRSIVTRAVDIEALEYLNSIASGHSKAEDLVKTRRIREEYFVDNRFSKSEIELLFALRTRTVPDIKANFPSQHKNNLVCDLCQVAIDCQEHLLTCYKLNKNSVTPSKMSYSDIYKDTTKQLGIVKHVKKLLRIREVLKSG